MHDPSTEVPWERELIREHLQLLYREQVKDRRYRMGLRILRSIGFIAMIALVFKLGTGASASPWEKSTSVPHVAYININGQIAADSNADADRIVPAIQEVFKNENASALVLQINSPGGSPVHSGRIYEEIKAQKAIRPELNVYAVIGDIGASGGYYIAAAADEIYADQASLVGSIGVISAGFGFTGLMDKLGIERRAFTAGDNKALLDPFSPVDQQVQVFWESVLERTHQQFIKRVKEGRGDRLIDDPLIFSGLMWNGEQALEIGLIDGLGSMTSLARDVIGVTNTVNYTPSRDFLHRLTQRARVAVTALVDGPSVRMY